MFFYNESDSEVSQVQPTVSDPYFYNTSLLLKMDSDFSDSSVHQHNVTTGGNVAVSNSEFKYDGGSGYFGGNGGYLAVSANTNFDFGTEDFTVEAWVYHISGQTVLFSLGDGIYKCIRASQNHINVETNVNGASSVNVNFSSALLSNQWNHIALVRNNNVLYAFNNGVIGQGLSYTKSIGNGSEAVHIGRKMNDPASTSLNGYIDDLRITKGVARYTANFTPPDSHPTTGPSEIVSTGMVLELDAEDYETVGYNGGTKTSAGNDPIYVGTGEKYFQFNGAGHISWPSNSDYGPGTGDFAVELWTKGSSLRLIQSDNTIDSVTDDIWVIGIHPDWGMMFNIHGPGNRGFRGGVGHNFDNWTHTVMVRKQGNNAVYINGQKQALSLNNIDGESLGQSGLIIGAGTPNIFTTGQIAAARLFNRSLAEAEVLQNFEATKSRFGL